MYSSNCVRQFVAYEFGGQKSVVAGGPGLRKDKKRLVREVLGDDRAFKVMCYGRLYLCGKRRLVTVLNSTPDNLDVRNLLSELLAKFARKEFGKGPAPTIEV